MKAGHLLRYSIFLLLFLLLCLPHCTRPLPSSSPVRRVMKPMMGTLVEILWRESDKVPDAADRVRSVLDRMEGLASGMNLHSSDSELARINAAAGVQPVKASADLFEVIAKAQDVSVLTRGAFDPTVGSVEAVWGDIQWDGSQGTIPTDTELRDALKRVGGRFLKLDKTDRTVFLTQKGARLDLGGIAKGYIIDRGISWLREKGLECVMINAGGDIRACGCLQSPPWKVGLRNPVEKEQLLGVFRVRDEAVVTSGSYERFFENEQGRFSHIVDPHTGRPVQGLLSVTVMAPDAALADALATAFMVTGRKKSLDILAQMPPVRTVFVEADGTIWIDERLRAMFEPSDSLSGMQLRYFGM